MGKKRLIYLSSPYSGAVVEGQVYELLEYYKHQGWFEDVLLIQSFSDESEREKAAETLKKFTFRYKFFWINPYYPHLYLKSVKSLRKVLNEDVKDNTVFHVRGGLYAFYLRKALPRKYRNLYILDEFRGLASSELDYTKDNSLLNVLKTWVKKHHTRWCYHKMQKDENLFYTAVSPLLKKIEADQDSFDQTRISIHPNIASGDFVYNPQKKKEIREKLGVDKDQILIVTSSGESGKWQKDLDLVNALTAKGFVVLNLSKKEVDKPNVISLFVPHKEMPDYLSACDAALLWRDDVLLNNVASPSKYSEFAVMGLFVIHNKTVDLATSFIKDNHCGILVDNPHNIILNKEDFSEEERKRRCICGYNMFSIEIIAKNYKEHYENDKVYH